MKIESRTSVVVLLISLATVLALYLSGGNSQTARTPSSAEQQKEVAELKNQIAVLAERVNMLEERLAEPRRHKELPL